MPWTLNGEPVSGDFNIPHVEQTDDGPVDSYTQYPGHILDLWSDEDLEALGLVWVEPEPVAPTVPTVVGAMQIRIALARAGKLDDVEAWANDPATDRVSRIYWEYATEVQRSHPMVAGVAQLLGYTGEQIDQLFIEAKSVV